MLATLVVLNIVNNRVAPQEHYLLWAFGGSLGFLALGLLDGNTWTDMGLGFGTCSRPIWGGACVGVITLVYLIGASMWRTRAAFQDDRISDLSGPR